MNNPGLNPGRKRQVDESIDMMEPISSAEAPAEEKDPASFRDLTKEEILEGIARGYKSALVGNYRPVQELLDELDEIDA